MADDDDLIYSQEELDKRAAAEREANKQREDELDDLRDLLNSGQGLRFFRRLLEQTHIFQTSIGPNIKEREGERNIGLWLWSEIIQAHPESVTKLIEN